MGGIGSGAKPKDISMYSPVRRVYLLAGRGYTVAEIVQETGLSERDVQRCLSISRHGRDRIEEREQRRQFVERALVTGLATGGTVVQIAKILGDTLPTTDKALRALRERYGAKTNAHLIAILLTSGDPPAVVPSPVVPPLPPAAAVVLPPSPALSLSGSVCPDCGGQLSFSEGCEKCQQCGYSRC